MRSVKFGSAACALFLAFALAATPLEAGCGWGGGWGGCGSYGGWSSCGGGYASGGCYSGGSCYSDGCYSGGSCYSSGCSSGSCYSGGCSSGGCAVPASGGHAYRAPTNPAPNYAHQSAPRALSRAPRFQYAFGRTPVSGRVARTAPSRTVAVSVPQR